MADAQAEKPCKPEGLDARIEAFQCAAENFRAHIDAERHLQLHTPRCDLGRRWRGQHGVELALRGTFGRFLQDAVDDIVRRCSDRLGVGGNGPLPARHQRAAAVAQQRGFPEQADGEQIGDACIGCAAQLCLPEPIPGELAPAAQRGQQAVEITVQCVLRKSQASDTVDDGVFGIGRRLRHIPCETCQAGDFRSQIVGRDDPPGAVGATVLADRPQRLALVEIAGCPVTDALVDDAGPVDRIRVAGQLGDRGERLRGRACGLDRLFQCGQVRRPQGCRRVLQGGLQILLGDLAGL